MSELVPRSQTKGLETLATEMSTNYYMVLGEEPELNPEIQYIATNQQTSKARQNAMKKEE
jgi:hypothetical protein